MKKLPPIMGWSTWNQFKQDISEEAVLGVAEAIRDNGLLSAGYRYINLDDCWQASERDENKRLAFDIGRFPSGEGIVAKLNNMGFRAGIYSSSGNLTCEDMPGSYGYEDLDAETFVAWGFEYLKYDYCHVVDLPTDPHHNADNFATDTPPISYIGVSQDGGEIVIPASQGELTAPATLNDGAIYGLNCPRASCTFTLDIPEAGRYQVAIGYRKKASLHRRFLLMSVGGVPSYQVWFPPTSGWNSPSRVMAMVDLKKGENKITLTNPIRGQCEDTMLRYTRMGEALKKAALRHERPIFYAICEHGRTTPWEWAGDVASSWRVSGDISPRWEAVVRNYEIAADLHEFQKPGAYNDPDMLEVGIGNLTEEENRSHFILWCMLCAPLILGLDVRKADAKTLALISDPELIAINQDPLLQQASRTKLAPGLDLLIKPLTGDRVAICLFNKSDAVMTDVALPSWAGMGEGVVVSHIAPHGVELYVGPQ